LSAPAAPLNQPGEGAAVGPSGSNMRRRVLTGWLSLQTPWSGAGFPLIVGAVLAQKGFKLPDTLLFMGVGMLGPAFGSWLAAPFIDRWERRVALALFSTVQLTAIGVFIVSRAPAVLVAAYFTFGLFAALILPTLTLYVAELFPTDQRARASSSAWTMNRVASALAPLALVPLVRSNGPSWAFLLLAVVWVMLVAVLALAPPGRQRRAIG
jgi:putative MFS transporter